MEVLMTNKQTKLRGLSWFQNIKVWKINDKHQYINTQKPMTTESITHCFHEGDHPSWDTSPWSNFHCMGLYICFNFEKKLFTNSCCLYNLLQWLKNIKIYQEWLFVSQNWSKIGSIMGKTNFPTISPPNLENIELTLLNLENLPKKPPLPSWLSL